MRFCCKTEDFTESARFWSQMFPTFLLSKQVTTLYVYDQTHEVIEV